jgi:hypothetical protein
VIEPELERFLARFEEALRRSRRRDRRRAIREAHDHLLCAAAERQSGGSGRAEAVRDAIASFGSVDAIAAGYRAPRSRTNLATATGLALTAVLAALTIAPTSIIPTSHAAESNCPARWNSHPVTSVYRSAWVSASGSGCDVVLHDARRARVFHQASRDGGWQLTARPVAGLSADLRMRDYVVGGDGRIERRIPALP